ncbi:MAG: DMT family transporter [Candidatus Kapaibacterium sp.]
MNESSIGLLAAFFTVVVWTISTFSFAHASRMTHPGTVNRIRLLFAVIILTVLVCVIEGVWPWQLLHAVSTDALLYFGISGLVGFTIGDTLFFTAFKILGSRRASIFTCIAPAAALLAGMPMLEESLSAAGVAGMLVSMSGILMLSLSRKEQEEVRNDGHGRFGAGVLYAVLGAVCQGVGIVLSRKGFAAAGSGLNAVHAAWIRIFVGTASAYLVSVRTTPPVAELRSALRDLPLVRHLLSGTVLGPVLGVSSSLLAVQYIEASIAQTILALTPVTVTLVSAARYKDRVSPLAAVAVALSLAGVIILVWRDSLP